ncbi:Hypothetical predicted protein [Mytilus galloprovincialis]|uniref:Uncharacterized protein n=1 Tax=Mytilus galloprovincialis TaxID=29158 RepID=A0A8B6GAQ4_MYTGA|nr:Hypothetical predicted protein [Mytilus galloprovincialis]
MMETNTSFRGFFETDCQKKSVPQSLKTLIGMILGGPNIETQSGNFIEAQCTLTIAQLLQFNFSVRRRKESSMQSSHSTDREPPLPTYLGLLIHAETRKRGLVDKLYDLGLSISYDRIMQLSTALGNSICESFNTENVVCPAKLRNGIFTSAAIDNIDHNPSSTTAQGSLHGTAIFVIPTSGKRRWLKHVYDNIAADDTEDMEYSWAAFHANRLEGDSDTLIDISSLLPLFQEEAKSVAMIRHAMNVIMNNVNFLNPGQLPVITCDQPLYAIAKSVQWNCMFMEERDSEEDQPVFEEWIERREIESPLFHYWSLTMKFEMTILMFIRSLREGNFQLYKDSIALLIPWFFALDHPNYARWLPIHLRDMMVLHDVAPTVAKEFDDGRFVVRKSHKRFSAIAIDQAHEQNNKLVKGDGGAIGLTENMTQLQRWMVSGPEIARVINEFESAQERIKKDQSKGPDLRHHEQVKSRQDTFSRQVKAFCSVLEEMGNPFMEQSDDLLILDTRDIVDPRVAETVRKGRRNRKRAIQQVRHRTTSK